MAEIWVFDISGGGGVGSGGGGGEGGGHETSRKRAGRTPPGEHARRRMLALARQRIRQFPPPLEVDALRFPAGIFFARDRGTGEAGDIREEISSSFDYWSKDSGEHFDLFFPGWYFHRGKLRFNSNRFLEYRDEIQKRSKWRYSGETDLLILNFDYNVRTGHGKFSFDEVIVLQVEAMIRDKRIASLPTLLNLINNSAKVSPKRGQQSVVWRMSDKMGLLRGRQSLWEALKKFFLKDFGQVYDNVRPYGVFDLRRSS